MHDDVSTDVAAVPTHALLPDGPEVSRLVLGMWRLADWGYRPGALRGYVEACVDLGVTTFDHADIYCDYTCEARFGEAVDGASTLRDRMQLISKCDIKLVSKNRPSHAVHHYDTSREHIVASVEHSLDALGTDRLDVLLLHRPDPLMDADEVAEAFRVLRRDGKVLHFGVSNFPPSQFRLLADRVDAPLVTNQVQASLTHRAPFLDGTFDQCQRRRVAPMAWSPFGGGDLFRSEAPPFPELRVALQDVADAHGGVGVDQVALAWLLRHPAGIVPILGTGKIERVRRAADATTIDLTRPQWFRLWSAAGGQIP